MPFVDNIVRAIFEDPKIEYKYEDVQEYRLQVSSVKIQLFNWEKLKTVLDNFSSQDKIIIDFKMDEGDPFTINSKDGKEKIEDWLTDIKDQNLVRDEDSTFYLTISIVKTVSTSNGLNIYDFEDFVQCLNGLSLKGLLTSFNNVLGNRDFIRFNLLNSDEDFYTNTFCFSGKGTKGCKNQSVAKDQLLEEGSKVRYFLNAPTYPFIPEDFFLVNRSSNQIINEIFDKLALVYTLIYVADISEFPDADSLKVRCNGYKTVNNALSFKGLDPKALKLFYPIYQWIYDEGNLVDKIGIARNVITLHARNNSILNITDNAYETIKSNYIIYQKQNLQQYIGIKNQVTQFIYEMALKSNELVDSFASTFKKNIQWLVTFYITVLVFNTLSRGRIENIFTQDITYISYGILAISVVVLLLALFESFSRKGRFLQQYDETKQYYDDLLDTEDLEKIFKEGKSREENNRYINKKIQVYAVAWLLVVLIMAIVTYKLNATYLSTK